MNWTAAQWELFIIAADTFGTAVLAVVMVYLRSIFVTHREHRELAAAVKEMSMRLSSGDGRFKVIEERLRQLPTSEQLHALGISMARLEGNVSALTARLDGGDALQRRFEHQLDIMDEFLRKHGA